MLYGSMDINGHGIVYNGDVIGIDAIYYYRHILAEVHKIHDNIKNNSLIRWFNEKVGEIKL